MQISRLQQEQSVRELKKQKSGHFSPDGWQLHSPTWSYVLRSGLCCWMWCLVKVKTASLGVSAHSASCEAKINPRHGRVDRNTLQLPLRGKDLDQRSGNDLPVVVLDLPFNGFLPAGGVYVAVCLSVGGCFMLRYDCGVCVRPRSAAMMHRYCHEPPPVLSQAASLTGREQKAIS